jgi:hypothetical protein
LANCWALAVLKAFDLQAKTVTTHYVTPRHFTGHVGLPCRYDVDWVRKIQTVTTATDPRICQVKPAADANCAWCQADEPL